MSPSPASMKRVGQVWIRVFPDKPITLKPAETRMGKGKGAPEYWVAVVKPGRILFEINGVDQDAGQGGPAASARPSCRSRPASSAGRESRAMKKAHELRDLPLEELESLEREKAEELMNLKIQLKMRQLDNPLQVRNARREIAVIKTVITEKKSRRLGVGQWSGRPRPPRAREKE